MAPRKLALTVALLLTAIGFTGCLGGSEGGDAPSTANEGDDGDASRSGDTGATGDGDARANVTDTGEGFENESVGEMEHFHDYWKGRERVVLFDEDVEPDPFTTTFFTFYDVVARQNPAVGGAFVQLPDGAIVFEGTGQLEVTTTYSDPRVNDVGFRYRDASGTDWSDVTPIGDGETVTIDVTPEMTDLPHMGTSKWRFLFEPASAGGTIAGPFHVTIAVVKMRDVELFPGHPDHFAGAPEKVLLDTTHTSTSQAAPFQIVDFASGNPDEEQGLPPEHIVPMQTQEMQVRIIVESASSSVGDAQEPYLSYRSAESARWRWASAVEGSLESGELLYAFPVEAAMVDSPYAEESQWRFEVRGTSDPAGQGGSCGGCTDTEITYRIIVTALDHAELTEGGGHEDEAGEDEPEDEDDL